MLPPPIWATAVSEHFLMKRTHLGRRVPLPRLEWVSGRAGIRTAVCTVPEPRPTLLSTPCQAQLPSTFARPPHAFPQSGLCSLDVLVQSLGSPVPATLILSLCTSCFIKIHGVNHFLCLRLQGVFLMCHCLLLQQDLDSEGLLWSLEGELTGLCDGSGSPSAGSGLSQTPWSPAWAGRCSCGNQEEAG